MVLSGRCNLEDSMPQIVPSAGFTPPCDYSNFADNFDLSLLPEGDNFTPVSPSATFYAQSPPPVMCGISPKISTTFYPHSPQSVDNVDLGPDFQKLLGSPEQNDNFLKVPATYHPSSPSSISSFSPYSPQSDFISHYPSSPSDSTSSLYPHSPNSCYSQSPSEGYQTIKKEFYPTYNIKEENFSNCATTLTTSEVLDLLGTAIIKQETAIDFENILHSLQVNDSIRGFFEIQEKPKDHQLLREVLRDTSFQKKYNIKPLDFDLVEEHIKMEIPDEDIIDECSEPLTSDTIDPVLNLAILQMKKDIKNTCTALSISSDPSQWSSSNVWSWMQWTSNQYGLTSPTADQWDLPGSNLVNLTEDEFTRRSPQCGSILYAQLEIWKAAFSEEEYESTQWIPKSTSSNASSGDVSDEEEEEPTPELDTNKPTTSRTTGSSHIHLWQFLKELLASPQIHGSCIRWIDRTKGIFKIEDSVKVARLWGKRKNRPAMNYDKLSRSIRQYYKKGIMKKTERSQRLVYQFCHPYNL